MDGEHARRNAKRRFHIQTFYERYKALIICLFGSFWAVVGASMIKSISGVNVEIIIATRFIGFFVFNLPILIQSQNVIFKMETTPTLLLRAVFSTCCLCLYVLAITLMPIGDVFVLYCTAPALACILSKIILKENFDLFNSLSVASTMLCLVFMSRVFSLVSESPSDKYSDLNYWLGCASQIGSSLLMALSMICVRKLGDVAECVIVGYQSAAGLLVSVSFCLVRWKFDLPRCGWDAAKLVLVGFVALISQTFLTMSVKCDKAGAISSIQIACQVACSFLAQVTIFGDVPDVHSILAAVCVFVSLWLSGLRKRRQIQRRKADATTELHETQV